MNRKRSRFALAGLLALAICLAVGLVSGSVAEAKKKSKRSFTVSKGTPTVVPGVPGPGEAVAKIPIGTVGKKVGKGKVVSLNGLTVTTQFLGSPGFADDVVATVQGPSGREASLFNPVPNHTGGGNNETSSGPLTETPNSPFNVCVPDTPAPPPPCTDPDSILGPPYVGTVGNENLLNFSGSGVTGTWFVKVFNSGTNPVTLNFVTVTGGLITKPS
jgi:hypothetical protein